MCARVSIYNMIYLLLIDCAENILKFCFINIDTIIIKISYFLDVRASINPMEAFQDIDIALLLGAFPRLKGIV